MMRFEVAVNGERLCIAGLQGFGVLGAVLSWVKRNPEGFPETAPSSDFETWSAEELSLDVAGSDSNDARELKSRRWVDKVLKVGDVIEIRILPPGPADSPAGET